MPSFQASHKTLGLRAANLNPGFYKIHIQI